MAAAKSGAAEGDPLALRDRLIVELLYATGIRVSELCGLDIDDVDLGRRLLRVLGKGNKQRTMPFGEPAEDALRAWLTDGRPALATPDSGPALLLGARGRAARPAAGPHRRAPDDGRGRRRTRYRARTACGTAPPPTCSKAAPTCASSRNCSGTRRWRPRSSTPTSPSPGCVPCTIRRTRGPESPELGASVAETIRRVAHQHVG